jgi:TonB-dependent starch-binding outer membrane protein SusC
MNYFVTKFSALLFVMLFGLGLSAQRMVTGVISDSESKEPIIGATVSVKGTDVGTITDIDGKFSLKVSSASDVLVISSAGYADQEIAVGNNDEINISLATDKLLDEVVVVGYGSQKEKEITSAVTSVSSKDFNKGPISDPAQLLQGKVAGLQVYNRGGDPNRAAVIRMRGISTVGANTEPLVVIDGVIGASLQNVDPNDIEKIDVLKDGSASAIYGSRGSAGVLIVTTKKGKKNQSTTLSYNGQYGASAPVRSVQVMSATDFKAAGGTDLGSDVNWLDQVTNTGLTGVHNLSAQGGVGNTSFRISANLRDVNGILKNTGFDQFNTRLNLSTKALNDKLTLDFNTSLTTKNQNFGFNDALRYAVIYNPTAPILGKDSKYPFNAPQFGGYFETLGLFDSFNPVAINELNKNLGKRKEFNYGATLGYAFTDNLSLNFRVAQQDNTSNNRQYYPTTSLYGGTATSPTRRGRANFYNDQSLFKLYESYATFSPTIGKTNLTFTGGYSFQQDNFTANGFGAGDFANDSKDFGNLIGTSQDVNEKGLIGIGSGVSPDAKIIAFFGRVNATYDDAIFVNASLRREGSTKLGEGNKWGLFPSIGLGADLNKYLNVGALDILKLRLGYGVTGSLPRDNGLSQPIRNINNGADGTITTQLARAGNPDLKWEEKGELNLGLDVKSGKFGANIDLYQRNIKDFILNVPADVATTGANNIWKNAGQLSTKGFEIGLNYDVANTSTFNYTTGLVLSSYKTVLDSFVSKSTTRGNLGAPGQNGTNVIIVKEGSEIGNIWGPVFDKVSDKGAPVFKDINGDGKIVSDQAKALDPTADFSVLGNGIPDLEIGWTNSLSFGGWNVNAFFRGATGHSLVNAFRAFYEPVISTQSSYNFVNTSKKVAGLTDARFSSLYVEKADFFKLDNLTISRSIGLGDIKFINNLNVSLTGQNLFVLTGYSGADPEPSLVDYGNTDNGSQQNLGNPDVLSPGIDRRTNYFSARTVTLGINFNF